MKNFLLLPVVLMSLVLLVACGGAGQGSAPKDLVPASANLIAQVQVAKLLQDVDFESLYRQSPKGIGEPQSLDELLDMALQETGVDFRQFTSVVLFGDIAQDEEYFGLIAQGQISEDQVVKAIEDSGEYSLDTMDYSGQRIYLDREDVDNPAIAFMGGSTLVLGTLPAVQDVIDVQQGHLDRASGKVYDTFNDMGEPLFSMAMAIPPEARDKFDESLGSGQGFGMMPAMDALRDLEVVTVLVDKPGNDLKLEAMLEFINAQSAEKMSDTLDGFLKLAAGFAPDEGVRMLLDKLQLSVNGTRLTLKFQAPISEIQEVARSMEQDFGGPY